ncbi:MAG: sugar transferase [Clostridia bacterium]|nr:sugar transferase [Clostridia bacterium]
MYAKYIKRPMDFFLSLCAIIVLLPIFFVLIILGAIMMKGNPFFTQLRPGKDEKIFKLIKFRTMTCETDENGEPLPDEIRLTKYGKFLRSTSLDELPELFNILKGDMAVVGPRPLSVKYLGFYTETESHRHDVRPGLTGLAQAKGRNSLSWEAKFELDLEYIENISFINDVKIIFLTVVCVLKHSDIGQGEQAPISLHILRAQKQETEVL